ncbi:hypothetical protein [Ottowia sp.]|uniref:hypothetical protein n=1 Tax=Ottowia sp. TaxID=1898956 RepID=UPI002CDAD832|nr:hypothetical protein [Pseudomonadota bacterium]HOV20663.1 hypothetical protein [Ottowia sp.]
MTALLKMLARSGIAVGNPFQPDRRYRRPKHGDARGDFSAIAGDMRRVDADFRRCAAHQLTTDGQQTYKR